MTSHRCLLIQRGEGWAGAVEQARPASDIGPATWCRIWEGSTREAQAEAALDATEWCRQNNVKDFLMPILSGQIGVR